MWRNHNTLVRGTVGETFSMVSVLERLWPFEPPQEKKEKKERKKERCFGRRERSHSCEGSGKSLWSFCHQRLFTHSYEGSQFGHIPSFPTKGKHSPRIDFVAKPHRSTVLPTRQSLWRKRPFERCGSSSREFGSNSETFASGEAQRSDLRET